jgi:hypothetical protein
VRQVGRDYQKKGEKEQGIGADPPVALAKYSDPAPEAAESGFGVGCAFNTGHKFSSFLHVGVTLPLRNYFPISSEILFHFIGWLAKKLSGNVQIFPSQTANKKGCSGSMKNAQFFNDWVDQ